MRASPSGRKILVWAALLWLAISLVFSSLRRGSLGPLVLLLVTTVLVLLMQRLTARTTPRSKGVRDGLVMCFVLLAGVAGFGIDGGLAMMRNGDFWIYELPFGVFLGPPHPYDWILDRVVVALTIFSLAATLLLSGMFFWARYSDLEHRTVARPRISPVWWVMIAAAAGVALFWPRRILASPAWNVEIVQPERGPKVPVLVYLMYNTCSENELETEEAFAPDAFGRVQIPKRIFEISTARFLLYHFAFGTKCGQREAYIWLNQTVTNHSSDSWDGRSESVSSRLVLTRK